MTISKQSQDLLEERKNNLKKLVPEAFSEGKIDFLKLRQTLDDLVETGSERYSFTWAGKNGATQNRDKLSKATLKPDRKESVDFDTTQHLIIEGDNLEVLKILQKSYEGKVKMIYIDPPYNTGKDFVYKDDFKDPLKSYLEQTGQVDKEGRKNATNTESGGRKHSNWLSMMYPRLALARNLLREDGVIFISIDDNEVHNLRLIMNEIFGEENFVAEIIWEKKFAPQNDAKWLSDNHDYILLYAKNKENWRPGLLPRTDEANARYENPDNDTRGLWTSGDLTVKTYSKEYDYSINTPTGKKIKPPAGSCWRVSKRKLDELIKDNRIWFGQKGQNVPRIKRFLSEVKQGLTSLTIWKREEVGDNQDARREILELFNTIGVFDTPKPTSLIKKMLMLSTDKESIILDFFAGSGTTAHAVLAQNAEDGGNRRFILVQLPEATPAESEARKAGFKTIADICKERVRRVIKKFKAEGKQQKLGSGETKQDLGFKVFKQAASNCFVWDPDEATDADSLTRHIEKAAKGASDADPEDLTYELMLREGFPLDAKITNEKKGTNTFTKIEYDGRITYVCLDKKLNESAALQLGIEKEGKLICLDSALTDTIKTNLGKKFRVDTV